MYTHELITNLQAQPEDIDNPSAVVAVVPFHNLTKERKHDIIGWLTEIIHNLRMNKHDALVFEIKDVGSDYNGEFQVVAMELSPPEFY